MDAKTLTWPQRQDQGGAAFAKEWRWWLFVLVSMGIAWRLLRYALGFPIWGDEAFVCMNLLDRGYLDLAKPLEHAQIVPLLYLWSELTAYLVLGGSEWALRLVSLLAGLGGLLLYWRLCRQVLSPRACLLAVGILAASYFPVRHSCEVKPYAFDLFFAIVLLLFAVQWLHEPQRLRWLGWLSVVVPLSLLGSYPSVFVAGAVSLVLLPAAWQQKGWQGRGLYVLYNVVMAASFLGHFLLVGKQQIGVAGGETENFYLSYWGQSFPPSSLLAWPAWLLDIHTGDLLAYPVGGGHHVSTLTALLCLVGLVVLGRQRRWSQLGLVVLPFLLNLLAALMHRYPYGGVTRLAQHLAPAICLLAGLGAANVFHRLARTPRQELWFTRAFCWLLLGLISVGILRDLRQPYKTAGEIWAKQQVQEVLAQADPAVCLLVVNPLEEIKPSFSWYLRQHPQRIHWLSKAGDRRPETGDRRPPASGQEIWCLRYGYSPVPAHDIQPLLPPEPGSWTLIDSFSNRFQGKPREPTEHWQVFRFRAAP